MTKGEQPKVYDYLYSLDWGLCHGPVDSINQVWVKDKPIFCGSIRSFRSVCIDLPELFGGDGKEGGVYGVLEAYVGTDDQVASPELAAREGRTPDTFPGYRGLAHLFFRGFGGAGFKWATNNYYLPAIKTSITSVPKSLGARHAFVWPMGETPPAGLEDGVWNGNIIPVDTETYLGPSPSVRSQRVRPITHSPSTLMAGNSPIASTDGTWFAGPAQDGPVQTPDCEVLASARGYNPLPGGDETGEPPPELDGELVGSITAMTVTIEGEILYSGSYDLRRGVVSLYVEFYRGGTDSQGRAILGNPVSGGISRSWQFNGAFSITETLSIPIDAYYIRVWANVSRSFPIFTGLQVAKSELFLTREKFAYQHCSVNGTLDAMPDANPAHMIYECMVNPEWGKGESPSMLDTASFEQAAETLYNESFGLSMMWNRQDTIEAFVQEVLDHIKAVLFQNPSTGLWTLKLLRDDYDPQTLPRLTPENCVVRSGKRRRWGETVNQIVVSYTDPNSEEAATVTAHNIANQAVQGGTSAETRNYYGVRNANLAQTLANRDVIEAGTPLWAGSIEIDRSEWTIKPGDCRILEWPDESIESMVVRVLSVDYGKKDDRKIRISVVEDIFSVSGTAFSQPQGPLWTDDRVPATPVGVYQFTTLPYAERVRGGERPSDIQDSGAERLAAMADTGQSPVLDVQTWVSGASGFSLSATHGSRRSLPITSALPAEAFSSIPRAWVDTLGGGFIQPSARLMLGDSDLTGELIVLVSFDPLSQTWTVLRGALDTVPKAWPAGTRLWHYPDGAEFGLIPEFSPDILGFRILPRTRWGRLPLHQANTVTASVIERQNLPIRPANVQINGLGFADAVYDPAPTNLVVTWANRNRMAEDVALPPAWTDDDISPETGQTTRITLRRLSGAIIAVYDDLTGTSHTIAPSTVGTPGAAYVEVESKRDGLLSLQSSIRGIRLGDPAGWGYSWNKSWGH